MSSSRKLFLASVVATSFILTGCVFSPDLFKGKPEPTDIDICKRLQEQIKKGLVPLLDFEMKDWENCKKVLKDWQPYSMPLSGESRSAYRVKGIPGKIYSVSFDGTKYQVTNGSATISLANSSLDEHGCARGIGTLTDGGILPLLACIASENQTTNSATP